MEYGLESGNYIYGVDNIGNGNTNLFRVSFLKPNTTYYFRIISKNGCAAGSRSNEISVKTGRHRSASAVEGEDVEKSKEDSGIRPTPSVTPEVVIPSPPVKNVISIFFNWITFLFRKLLGEV